MLAPPAPSPPELAPEALLEDEATPDDVWLPSEDVADVKVIMVVGEAEREDVPTFWLLWVEGAKALEPELVVALVLDADAMDVGSEEAELKELRIDVALGLSAEVAKHVQWCSWSTMCTDLPDRVELLPDGRCKLCTALGAADGAGLLG